MKLIFRDRFFSSGITDIYNEHKELVGQIDLKSAFGSSIDVYGPDGKMVCKGSFPFLSSSWEVTDSEGEELGVVKSRFAFLTKTFVYYAVGRGSFEISSPAFSKEYEITNDKGNLAARFEQVNGWFESGAFMLHNQSEVLNSYELVSVIMGIYAIQKQQGAAAT
jgi:uncharacterized protein YxjI